MCTISALVKEMTAFEKKRKKIMQKLEDGDKESMLMYMLIKTTIDSIIQINAYREVDFPECAEFT